MKESMFSTNFKKSPLCYEVLLERNCFIIVFILDLNTPQIVADMNLILPKYS